MSDGWWILILIIGGVWLLWPKPKIVPRPTAMPAQPPRTAEEKSELTDVQAARRAREEMEREARASLKQHLKDQEAVQQKIARAREYMKETGLDHAIPSLWDMVEHWPHWIKLPDGRWNPPDGVTNIDGGGELKDRTSSWEWQGHCYSMHFTETRVYLPDEVSSRGDIQLEVDGRLACAISCYKGPESYETWHFADVDALNVGPWMADLIKMEGGLKQASERSTRETFAKFERDKADRLHFGE